MSCTVPTIRDDIGDSLVTAGVISYLGSEIKNILISMIATYNILYVNRNMCRCDNRSLSLSLSLSLLFSIMWKSFGSSKTATSMFQDSAGSAARTPPFGRQPLLTFHNNQRRKPKSLKFPHWLLNALNLPSINTYIPFKQLSFPDSVDSLVEADIARSAREVCPEQLFEQHGALDFLGLQPLVPGSQGIPKIGGPQTP